jgi:hypothetical protein
MSSQNSPINAELVKYARDKAATVRRLHRTSLPIPSAHGTAPAKEPGHIIAGILTFESNWKPPLGDALLKQEVGGAQHGIGIETALHRLVQEDVSKRQKTHPLVMRHELPHCHAFFAGGRP